MNANAKLTQVQDLARSKMLELQPFSGEEMNLPRTDNHRAGFVEGEIALARQILDLLDEAEEAVPQEEPVETEMLLGR